MHAEAIKGLISAMVKLASAGIDFKVEFFSKYGLERERNRAVEYFLGFSYDYLFFLDTDIVLEPDTILNLLADDKQIVGGLYFNEVNCPCVYDRVASQKYQVKSVGDFINKSIVEVDAIGCGCLLIRRDVLERIKPPWFKFFLNYGEDIYFCEKAKSHGLLIFVDIRVHVDHLRLVSLKTMRKV